MRAAPCLCSSRGLYYRDRYLYQLWNTSSIHLPTYLPCYLELTLQMDCDETVEYTCTHSLGNENWRTAETNACSLDNHHGCFGLQLQTLTTQCYGRSLSILQYTSEIQPSRFLLALGKSGNTSIWLCSEQKHTSTLRRICVTNHGPLIVMDFRLASSSNLTHPN